MNERETIRNIVLDVLVNVKNFPEALQVRALGQNMAPLADKIVDAVLNTAGHKMIVVEGEVEVCDTCVNELGYPVNWEQAHPLC